MRQYLLSICLLFSFFAAATTVDLWQFSSPERQTRAIDLVKQLRCLQCQNQNLLESTSPVARDLRLQVYQMVEHGLSDQQIMASLTQRFGDYILYDPPLKQPTLLLWFGPLLLLIGTLTAAGFYLYRHRNRQGENR